MILTMIYFGASLVSACQSNPQISAAIESIEKQLQAEEWKENDAKKDAISKILQSLRDQNASHPDQLTADWLLARADDEVTFARDASEARAKAGALRQELVTILQDASTDNTKEKAAEARGRQAKMNIRNGRIALYRSLVQGLTNDKFKIEDAVKNALGIDWNDALKENREIAFSEKEWGIFIESELKIDTKAENSFFSLGLRVLTIKATALDSVLQQANSYRILSETAQKLDSRASAATWIFDEAEKLLGRLPQKPADEKK